MACPGLFWNSFEMGNAVRWDTATCGNLRTPSEARSEQKHQAQGRATVDVCSSNGMAAYAPTESCALGNDTGRTHHPHYAPVLRRQARGVELASRRPERRKSLSAPALAGAAEKQRGPKSWGGGGGDWLSSKAAANRKSVGTVCPENGRPARGLREYELLPSACARSQKYLRTVTND